MKFKYKLITFVLCGVIWSMFSCNKTKTISLELDPPKKVLNRQSPGTNIRGTEQFVSESQTFKEGDIMVSAFFYYGFNSGSALFEGGLTDHPSTSVEMSYDNLDWYKEQVADMVDAGIDVILVNYVGDTENMSWSVEGLKKLVKAIESFDTQEGNPPQIGLFYSTMALLLENKYKTSGEKIDLKKQFGREYFYKIIRDFYSLVPSDLRARVDLKPVVWLGWDNNSVLNYDQRFIDYSDQAFSLDFGGDGLYILKENEWENLTTDGKYESGASKSGIKMAGHTAIIGPGFDNRGNTLDKEEFNKGREDGNFYSRQWKSLIEELKEDTINTFITIESWNDFRNGNEIAPSEEYGKVYIDTTSKYISFIKDNFSRGGHATADEGVFITFDDGGDENGIELIQQADGQVGTEVVNGVVCAKPLEDPYGGHFMYLKISDEFKEKKEEDQHYRLSIVYYDNANTGFGGNYDSFDPTAAVNGAYKGFPGVVTKDTKNWEVFSYDFPDARFENRENGGADLRIQANNLDLRIRKVSIEIIN